MKQWYDPRLPQEILFGMKMNFTKIKEKNHESKYLMFCARMLKGLVQHIDINFLRVNC